MNILQLGSLLPLVFRILNIIPQIQAGLKTGVSIFDLLQKFSPDLIDIVKTVGGTLFPNLTPENQVQAGALIAFDPDQVRYVQDSLNRLGVPDQPLIVDGHYGAKTKAAIEKFQAANPPLVVDGWGGRVTQAVIQAELVKLPPPPAPAAPSAVAATGATS